MFKKIALTFAIVTTLAGCNSLASSTNTLNDERIKSISGGALGYSPEELTLVNRRTEGTNTFATLKTRENKEFVCIINGGNIMTFGMTNPPQCAKKGEPINGMPF